MSNAEAYNSWDVKTILSSDMGEDGTFTAQLGDPITGAVDSDGAEMWLPPGFAARPTKPTPGESGCQAVVFRGVDRDACVGTRDLRSQAIYGNMSEGDTCMFSLGANGDGQAKVITKGDGAVVMHTTDDNTHDGKGVYLRIDPKKLEFRAPWGRITFDATGFTLVLANGAKFNLGGVTPAFGAISGGTLSSYCNISAQSINLNGTCYLGPSLADGGLPKMPAQISLIPPVAPFVPSLGAGVGAVTLFQTSSTKVFISA